MSSYGGRRDRHGDTHHRQLARAACGLGMDFRMHYFASRSAPMGAVSANVVAATFYNFNPQLVAGAIPAAWGLAS
ncbi:MAG: helix-turn-helix domain-containing protein, partial [Mycobacterium sp.]